MTQNPENNSEKQTYIVGIMPAAAFRGFVEQQQTELLAAFHLPESLTASPVMLSICSFTADYTLYTAIKRQLQELVCYEHPQHVYCDTLKVNTFKGTLMLLPTLHSRSYLKDIFFRTQRMLNSVCKLTNTVLEPQIPMATGLTKQQAETLAQAIKRVDSDFYCDNLCLYSFTAGVAEPLVERFPFGNQKKPTGQLELF